VVLLRQTPAEVRPASTRRRLKRQGVGDQATCDDTVGHGDFDDRIGRRLGVGVNEGAGDVDTATLEAEQPRYRAIGRPFAEGDRTLSGSGDWMTRATSVYQWSSVMSSGSSTKGMSGCGFARGCDGAYPSHLSRLVSSKKTGPTNTARARRGGFSESVSH
jgi:hypothetical protein